MRRRAGAAMGALRDATSEVDVVVIGSGIGGLCAGSVLAKYGKRVLVCEAHGTAGGAAHGFRCKLPKAGGEFFFDTGPSFFSGLSDPDGGRINPLKAVFDLLEVELPCHQYRSFGLCLPEGDFTHTPNFGSEILAPVSGKAAKREWDGLLQAMKPLAALVEALPVPARRTDLGALLTAGRFLPRFAAAGPWGAAQLTDPFAETVKRAGLTDPFARRWLDLLCFCLSGLPSDGTVTAEMAMMFGEFYKPSAIMDYPVGGVKSLVEVLVNGLEKYGGELRLRSPVKEILVEEGRAVGVRTAKGDIRAATVICNVSAWDMAKLLPPETADSRWCQDRVQMPPTKSFMHLHVGFDATGLDLGKLQPHYICLKDWQRGVEAEENAVLISIPSVEDSSLAPEGCGVLHAYTPATESWDRWKNLDRRSEEYKVLKEQRAEYLWKQLERPIPDIRQRSKVHLIGTPLTHQRFLHRYQGTYGPRIKAGQAEFPGAATPLPGLLLCGDSCFARHRRPGRGRQRAAGGARHGARHPAGAAQGAGASLQMTTGHREFFDRSAVGDRARGQQVVLDRYFLFGSFHLCG